MSKGRLLRDLVNARLTAAAEEIFALFNKTIAEYEEELGRSKEENKRLLDSIVSPRTERVGGVNRHVPSLCPPGPSVTIKNEPEEQSIKHEEQLLSSESTVVCVKKEEESLPPQQRQTEHQDELECEMQTEDNPDDDEDWVCPLSEGSETDDDGNHSKRVKSRRNKSASKTRVMLGTEVNTKNCSANEGDESIEHQCPVCKKIYKNKQILKTHSKIHSGERPFSCSICMKTFIHRATLDSHKRIHTGERPFSCAVCKKTFTQRAHLLVHKRIHTGEKPYSCPVCNKTFSRGSSVRVHERVHNKH